MGLLSASTALTRYKVEGQLENPIIDSIAEGLQKGIIRDIDNHPTEQTVGWTTLQTPFDPDFKNTSFIWGSYVLFSLRIDKKSIPAKLLQKHYATESALRLKAQKRDFLSADEKKALKEQIVQRLNEKMPATPNIFDVIWDYEKASLWFFSNLKSANEQLESLFFKSFRLRLIRLMPYTLAFINPALSNSERDALGRLAFKKNRDG